MRKPRAVLYDDDRTILEVLTLFFEGLGYEVLASAEPLACPVYDACERCHQTRPCADLMITDLVMPRMTGLELIQLQAVRGCGLTLRNKAILSGNLDPATAAAVRRLGCGAFLKPCRLSTLGVWVQECEERMDLTRPLATPRRERREPWCSRAVFSVGAASEPCVGEVVNRSGSGICVRLDRPVAATQVLDLRTSLPLPSERLLVRWSRPAEDGGYLAGLSCC